MPTQKYNKKVLQNAADKSHSIADILKIFELKVAGGNYQTIRNKLYELNINTDHFTGQGWNKGKKFPPKRAIEDYLNNKYTIKSYNLKKRLVGEGVKNYSCEKCHINSWLGTKLTLELDHIDGDHHNNNLENLQILCPNCHSQTPTFRNKKRISQ